MSKIMVYTVPGCIKCKEIIEILRKKDILFNEEPITTELIVSLIMKEIFILEAPIIKINEKYYSYEDILEVIEQW